MESYSAKIIDNLFTQADLVDQIRQLGIKSGDVLELHVSMKAIGFVLGGANALLEAFLEVLSHEGTLVMAAQAWDNSEPAYFEHPPIAIDLYEQLRQNHPVFQGKHEDIHKMGALAQVMQRRTNAYVSNHPQVAIMAIGKHAKWITQNHDLSSMFSPESPLGKLRELKAKVLLIGVDYDVCTAMHLGEHLSQVRPIGIQGARVVVGQHSEWVKFLSYIYDSDAFKAIGISMEVNGLVKMGDLGQTTTKLLEYEALTRFTQTYLKNQP
jgi:aminoglycoside 3-N-acetyltransferase